MNKFYGRNGGFFLFLVLLVTGCGWIKAANIPSSNSPSYPPKNQSERVVVSSLGQLMGTWQSLCVSHPDEGNYQRETLVFGAIQMNIVRVAYFDSNCSIAEYQLQFANNNVAFTSQTLAVSLNALVVTPESTQACTVFNSLGATGYCGKKSWQVGASITVNPATDCSGFGSVFNYQYELDHPTNSWNLYMTLCNTSGCGSEVYYQRVQ